MHLCTGVVIEGPTPTPRRAKPVRFTQKTCPKRAGSEAQWPPIVLAKKGSHGLRSRLLLVPYTAESSRPGRHHGFPQRFPKPVTPPAAARSQPNDFHVRGHTISQASNQHRPSGCPVEKVARTGNARSSYFQRRKPSAAINQPRSTFHPPTEHQPGTQSKNRPQPPE